MYKYSNIKKKCYSVLGANLSFEHIPFLVLLSLGPAFHDNFPRDPLDLSVH
jgi:hypothetical protein